MKDESALDANRHGKEAMQATLLCATCAIPLAFKVPELTGNRWHIRCESCGARTALEAIPTEPEELATFNAVGIYSSR